MSTSESDVKLYAGKFKSVEELEAGYNNSAKVYQENEDLKRQIEQNSKVPDDYAISTDIQLHESDLNDLKQAAKESGLTQQQFDRLAAKQNQTVKAKFDNFENAKKELGTDNLNLLQDFLNKTYPAKVADKMLSEAIRDKEIREQIMQQRTTLLNSSVPGSNKVSMGTYNHVTHDDLKKARDTMMSSRGKARIEAQKRYVALSAQMAHARD